METFIDESLAKMLSASLSTSGLGPIIDAKQASVLLGCSEEHIERLAESGRSNPSVGPSDAAGHAGRCWMRAD